MKKQIKAFLIRHDLFQPVYRVYSALMGVWRKTARRLTPARIRREEFYGEFERFQAELEALAPLYRQKTLLFHGYFMQGKRKDLVIGGSRRLADAFPGCRVLFLNTPISSAAAYNRFRERYLPVDSLTLPRPVTTPWHPSANTPGIRPTPEMRSLMEEKPYLRVAIDSAAGAMPELSREYLETVMCEAWLSYDKLLSALNIAGVCLWCEFKYNHYLLSEMCRERGIPVSFAEYGSLPATLVLDREGQMGESYPARHPEEFTALPVTDEEIRKAEKIVAYLKESGINRRNQPVAGEHGSRLDRLVPGKPILLFAGQLDQDSGLVPYTETSRTFHSPVYRSTLEAAAALAEIAARHDWNYIFKPHPAAVDEVDVSALPRNTIYIDNININEIIDIADVTVTILSSTVYVSLVRGTAAVMLGYNQVHGKGCVYEALRPEDVEPVLCRAVEEGFTREQQAAFYRHVAQMEKYYLFADCVTKTPIPYGRDFSQVVGFFGKMLEEAAERPVPAQRSLVLCNSLTSLLAAVHLRFSLPREDRVTLAVLDDKGFTRFCDLDRVGSCFDDLLTLRSEDLLNADLSAEPDAEEEGEDPGSREYRRRRKAIFANARRLLPLEGITDLYAASLTDACLGIAMAALEKDQGLRLHVADLKQRPYFSYREMKYYLLRDSSFSFEDLSETVDRIVEFLTLDTRGFSRASSHPTALTPLPVRQQEGEPGPLEIFKTESSPYFAPLRASSGLDLTLSRQLFLLDVVEESMEEDPFAPSDREEGSR